MFTKAVRSASHFTFPYVGLRRTGSGEVHASLGAFVVVNADGWALTSGHIVDDILACERDTQAIANGELQPADATNRCARHVELWAVPGFQDCKPRLAEARVRPLSDVALVRLESLGEWVPEELPLLRDVAEAPLEQGVSVCRYGYPFHHIEAGYDLKRNEFSLQQESFPVPSFALDGIIARFRVVRAPDGANALFVETSTPGLKGQSGGPLLDVDGRVCGLQSHTTHLDLGFDARFDSEDGQKTERQFLNVGAASHVNEIVSLLDEAGVAYVLG